MLTLFINLIVILIVVAVLYLVFYLFQKYVHPVDNKIVGIVLFIVFAILIVYAVTNKGLHWW